MTGQTKDYRIGICCFSAKHTALRRKSKDWLAWNQDNVSEWGNMSTRGLLFQWTSTTKIQLSVLFSPRYSWKIAEHLTTINHSLVYYINKQYKNLNRFTSSQKDHIVLQWQHKHDVDLYCRETQRMLATLMKNLRKNNQCWHLLKIDETF